MYRAVVNAPFFSISLAYQVRVYYHTMKLLNKHGRFFIESIDLIFKEYEIHLSVYNYLPIQNKHWYGI